jgi:cytochrome c553
MYLAFGCWRCHGTDAAGKDADAVGMLKWNGRPLAEKLHSLADQEGYLCGSDGERVYRTISIGMGGGIMPPYQGTIEAIGRPEKEPPKDWGKGLKGKVSEDDLRAVRGWYGELPEMVYVRGMTPSQRRKRAGEMIWDLVHYLRSL